MYVSVTVGRAVFENLINNDHFIGTLIQFQLILLFHIHYSNLHAKEGMCINSLN